MDTQREAQRETWITSDPIAEHVRKLLLERLALPTPNHDLVTLLEQLHELDEDSQS